MGLADDSVLLAMGPTNFQSLLRLGSVLLVLRLDRHRHLLGLCRRIDCGGGLLRRVRRCGDCRLRTIPSDCHCLLRVMGGACLYILRNLEPHLDHLLYLQCQWRHGISSNGRVRHDAGALQRFRSDA